MLVIDGKECENIEKAIKKYKKKYDRSRTLNHLRDRKYFTKPSVRRRKEKLKAVYRRKVLSGEIDRKR